MPLKQTDIISRSSDVSGAYNGNGCFDFYTDQEYWPKKFKINIESSYVQGPDGKKYSIFPVPNQWDIEQGRPPRYEYCTCNNEGKIKKSWNDGIWHMFINLENNESKITKELELKISTFIYSPFIHGAPN
jgi:hypothetical protein